MQTMPCQFILSAEPVEPCGHMEIDTRSVVEPVQLEGERLVGVRLCIPEGLQGLFEVNLERVAAGDHVAPVNLLEGQASTGHISKPGAIRVGTVIPPEVGSIASPGVRGGLHSPKGQLQYGAGRLA